VHALRCGADSSVSTWQDFDHVKGVVLHHPQHAVDLDRVGQVVGEEHQQSEAEEQQPDRDADGEPGELVDPFSPGDADPNSTAAL
jgi:hypothetical protein